MEQNELEAYESGYLTGKAGSSKSVLRDGWRDSEKVKASRLRGFHEGVRDRAREQRASVKAKARQRSSDDEDSSSSDLDMAQVWRHGALGAILMTIGGLGIAKTSAFSLVWWISALCLVTGFGFSFMALAFVVMGGAAVVAAVLAIIAFLLIAWLVIIVLVWLFNYFKGNLY